MALTQEQIKSFRDKYKLSPVPVTTPSAEPSNISSSFQGLKTLYGGGEQGIANKLATDVQQGAADIQAGMQTGGLAGVPQVTKGIVKAGLRTAGDVAGTVYAPIGAAIGATGLPKVFDKAGELSQHKGGILDLITNIPAVQEFAMKHPNAGEDFGRLMNLIFASQEKGTIDPKTAIPRTMEQIKTGISKTESLANKTVEKIQDIKATGNKIITSTGESITPTPEGLMQRVARIPKDKQAKFEQVAGDSVGGYLTKRGIFGNVEDITTQLYNRFKKSYQQADDGLAQLKGTFDPAPVRTMLEDLLSRERRISTEGAPSPILNAVEALASKKSWDMSEINAIKRLYEKNVKVDYLKTVNPEGVARATNLDTAVREWQFTKARELGLKNLDAINKETQLAKGLMDALGKEYASSAGNNAVSLTDWIVLSGGDPASISAFLVKKGFSSKSVQSTIAKLMSKNKTKFGDVKADVGVSSVRELPAPKTGTPNKSVNVPIRLPKKSSDIKNWYPN